MIFLLGLFFRNSFHIGVSCFPKSYKLFWMRVLICSKSSTIYFNAIKYDLQKYHWSLLKSPKVWRKLGRIKTFICKYWPMETKDRFSIFLHRMQINWCFWRKEIHVTSWSSAIYYLKPGIKKMPVISSSWKLTQNL